MRNPRRDSVTLAMILMVCGARAWDPPRRIGIAFVDRRRFPAANPTSAGALEATTATYGKAGLTPAAIPDLGDQAMAYSMNETTILHIRRADGLLSVSGTHVSRELTIAVARRAVGAPSVALGTHVTFPALGRKEVLVGITSPRRGYSGCEWRRTTAENSGFTVTVMTGDEAFWVPGPAPMLMVRRAADVLQVSCAEARLWPCVQRLTTAEVRAVKRPEVLTRAYGPRPGYSFCEWRASSAAGTGFNVSVATAAEFKARQLPDASAYLAAERQAMATFLEIEPLHEVGAEGSQADGAGQAVVMARTQDTVVAVSCFSCDRSDAIAIARLALSVT